MAPELCHVRDSIREIDSDSWIIGCGIHLTRQRLPPANYTWSDGGQWFYTVSAAPSPLPPTRPLSDTTHIKLVYDVGDCSAVFSLGGAFCKIHGHIMDTPNQTREHVTLEWLRDKRLSFRIPEVYYHAEFDSRYYIFTKSLPGQTLMTAWPHIDEETKQHYVELVVKACTEMAQWHGDSITGVDGNDLSELYLSASKPGVKVKDVSPKRLLAHCKEVGMDVLDLVFYHCDMGPGNIIVNLADRSMGIIDWETAGFVPRIWIRTKFRLSSGMDLEPPNEQYESWDWRQRVGRKLGDNGYDDVASTWMTWSKSKR